MLWRMRMAVLAVAATLALTGVALAHDHDDDDYYRGGNGAQAQRYGYQNGYRDGFNHGREDRFRNEGYDYRSEDFEQASRGYQSWMGNVGQFRDGYRQGYHSGYDAAFRRSSYGVYDRGGSYGRDGDGDADDRPYYGNDQRYGSWNRGNAAYNFGFRDGSTVAREDMARGKPYNPNPRGPYDDADHGYSSVYGDRRSYREQYTVAYRQGYMSVWNRGRY